MSFKVTLSGTGAGRELELATARRRGLLKAGQVVLAASDALAPTEPVARHETHMVETGFAKLIPGVEDVVEIGYEAYWAVWQEMDLNYHHPNGGQALFLTTALLTGEQVASEQVAAEIRATLA